METLSQLLNEAMEKKEIGVRSLERMIIEKYGRNRMISRSLISDYRAGKRAPTYEGALMLAETLEIPKRDFLMATYKLKEKLRQKAERSRFEEFCRKHSLEI